jgi:hypothetical protein
MRARTTLLLTALTLAATGAGASAAGASAPPTPDQGLNGACNMTNTNAGYGMFTISQFAANSVGNEEGWNEGMGTAINNSTGGNPAPNCGVPSSPPPRP